MMRGEILRKDVRFPSPCGDVVLKFKYVEVTSDKMRVSVPLRGCGFKIIFVTHEELSSLMVSVPLRGCGFKILAAGSLAVPASKWHFAARMCFPSFLRRRCVLKTFAKVAALSAARISFLSIAHCPSFCNPSTPLYAKGSTDKFSTAILTHLFCPHCAHDPPHSFGYASGLPPCSDEKSTPI